MSTEIVVAIATVISTAAAVGGIMLTVMFSFSKRFDRLDEGFTRIDEKFDRVDEKFDRLQDQLDRRFAEVNDSIHALEIRVDSTNARLERLADSVYLSHYS